MIRHSMIQRWLLAFAFSALAPIAIAQPAPAQDRLPPPVERVLGELDLPPAQRDTVRSALLRQHEERHTAIQALELRQRAELEALLTRDQLAALDAARPPPPDHFEGPRGSPPPRH